MKDLTLADALALTDDARVVTSGYAPFGIVHTNKAWADLTGYRFTDVVGKSCVLLQGPATQSAALDLLHAAIESKSHVRTQLVNYTRDGKPFLNYIECGPVVGGSHFVATIKGKPVTDDSIPSLTRPANAVSKEAAVAHETAPTKPVSYAETHRTKRSRRALEKTSLADALANTTDPLVLCAKEYPHVIMHPNQPWLEMCGYSLEEVEGFTNSILTGPETDGVAIERLLNCVKREEPACETLVNYKKGGQRFVNQVQVLPVYDENDELAAFMSMLREVGEDVSVA